MFLFWLQGLTRNANCFTSGTDLLSSLITLKHCVEYIQGTILIPNLKIYKKQILQVQYIDFVTVIQQRNKNTREYITIHVTNKLVRNHI